MLLSSGEITPPCGTPCFPLALSMIFSRCMTSASLGYFRQQPIMPDIVEIATQVDVDDARLLLNDRSRHTRGGAFRIREFAVHIQDRIGTRVQRRWSPRFESPQLHQTKIIFISNFNGMMYEKFFVPWYLP